MVHGKIGTAGSNTLYASGWGISNHQLWGLGGNDTLYGWTESNPDLATNDELYGDRTPQPGQIQYDPNTNPPGIPGDDIIYGGGGHDKLYGDGGNDFLMAIAFRRVVSLQLVTTFLTVERNDWLMVAVQRHSIGG
jgi:Ca2+-binding RTX toxin-like protein